MVDFGGMAQVLGLSAKDRDLKSAFGLISRIEHGLPVAALERVSQLLAPGDVQFKYKLIPKATYERRKTAHRLSSDEGTRLARVARVWSLARDIWESDEAAREFLFRPHPMIEDKRPVDVVIQTEFGAEMVIDILGGLKYGSAA
jgi:putative toxin-antitoxin system antitoxin component (TIGR02293 family)